MNGRWIKSQKIVRFPRDQFDPSAFLTPRDPEDGQSEWKEAVGEELDSVGGARRAGGGDTSSNTALNVNNEKGLEKIPHNIQMLCDKIIIL